MLIQLNIFNYLIKRYKYSINEYKQKLYDLEEELDKLNEIEYLKGFLDFINVYNLDTINIHNSNNG